MMQVAFINENTLGHSSYLLPFVRALAQRPELGVQPHVINATPLPEKLRRRADATIPGLRRWGLDFHNARWRLTVSRHVRDLVRELRARTPLDAIVVNTQSVALELTDVAKELPVLVCLDATFRQLSRTRWFAPNGVSRRLLPLTAAPIRGRERNIFWQARRLFPWSQGARESLVKDYRLDEAKITELPPSVELAPLRTKRRAAGTRPQILFVGGDFQRKGGPLLLDCFRRHFADQCELHLVTQSDVKSENGVSVHRGLTAQSAAWRQRWDEADLFVFPSTLETFGIVLLEALGFGVPVISADVGAAREILQEGRAGWILPEITVEKLKAAIDHALAAPEEAQARAAQGRKQMETHYDLVKNTARLAELLKQACVQ